MTACAAAVLALALQADPAPPSEPEEPDFAFFSGSPYTEGAGMVQFIWFGGIADDARTVQGRHRRSSATSSSLRVETGLTDRLEFDVVATYLRFSTSEDRIVTESGQGIGDTLLGIRYRLLDEAWAPVTLTLGPQVNLATGDTADGIGMSKAGYALDLTLGKDWDEHFFTYLSANYLWTPNVGDPMVGSQRTHDLGTFTYAAALGYRLWEHAGEAKGTKEDLHLYLEFQGNWDQGLEAQAGATRKTAERPLLLGFGLRYGITMPNNRLFEVGVMFAAGLNEVAPDRVILLQIQWEGGLLR
jgi:hypothetical protein